LVTKSSSSRIGPKPRKLKKKKGNAAAQPKTYPNDKLKGKCLKCGKKEHWKKECPYRLAKKNPTSNAFYLESIMMVGSLSTWMVDSGATNHICNSLLGFKKIRRLKKREHGLCMGNGTRVWA
jgi:hypothetical protein